MKNDTAFVRMRSVDHLGGAKCRKKAPRSVEWRLFIFISRESKWGTLQSAGNPRCAVPAEIHSICTDRPRPGPAAGLQVSPTSDTSQSVAILMNRPHLTFLSFAIDTNIFRRMKEEGQIYKTEPQIF